MSSTTTAAPATPTTPVTPELSLTRLHVMRAGYLLMGAGLAVVEWPRLAGARTLPLYEGVTLCLLTALGLLALLGLRHPVQLLPVLMFESLWKLLWLALVALPTSLAGTMDAATAGVAFDCAFVVLILAVTPWRHAWARFVRAEGDRWRR